MKKTVPTSVLVLLIVFANSMFVNAQETSPNLTNSFSTILNNASSYKNYAVIEKETMATFQSELSTYIKLQEKEKSEVFSQLEAKNNAIDALQKQITSLQSANAALLTDTKSFNFLGMTINKTAYSVVMWILFLSSVVFSGILFLNFKRANEIMKSSKSVLRDLEDEYESFRRVCIQREQNLKRKLFDEMKKTDSFRNAS